MNYTILEEYEICVCYLKGNDYAIAKLVQEYCMENNKTTVKNQVSYKDSIEAEKYYRPLTFNIGYWRLNIKAYEESNQGFVALQKILNDIQVQIFSNTNMRLKGLYQPYQIQIKGMITDIYPLLQIDIEDEEMQTRINETSKELLETDNLTIPTNMHTNSLIAQKCLAVAVAASGCEKIFTVDRLNCIEGTAQKYE